MFESVKHPTSYFHTTLKLGFLNINAPHWPPKMVVYNSTPGSQHKC